MSELNQLVKDTSPTAVQVQAAAQCAAKFDFLVRLLLDSCAKSKSRVLPPINWFHVTNSLMKSRFGERVQRQLVELCLGQLGHSQSPFNLVKNYLVDTNYFVSLSAPTQRVVLEHFASVCVALSANKSLLTRFQDKMRLFVEQSQSSRHQQHVDNVAAIVASIAAYFAAKSKTKQKTSTVDEDRTDQVAAQLVNFFAFLVDTFEFDPNDQSHV